MATRMARPILGRQPVPGWPPSWDPATGPGTLCPSWVDHPPSQDRDQGSAFRNGRAGSAGPGAEPSTPLTPQHWRRQHIY